VDWSRRCFVASHLWFGVAVTSSGSVPIVGRGHLDQTACRRSALELVGERWSLVVLRELSYRVRRFDGIARAKGVTRNMLAIRLKTLEQAGLVEARPYSERPYPVRLPPHRRRPGARRGAAHAAAVG